MSILQDVTHILEFWKTQDLLLSLEVNLDSFSINLIKIKCQICILIRLLFYKSLILFGYFQTKKINVAQDKTKQQEGVLGLNSALNHLKTYYQYLKEACIYINDIDKFENIWKQSSNLFNQ